MKTKEGSEQENPLPGVTEQARKNYEEALRNGLKLQEEMGRWWTNFLGQAPSAQDWQKRAAGFTAAASNLLCTNQKRWAEFLELGDKNYRASVDLVKKATDAAQTPAVAECQAKWMEVWTSSVAAARSSAETVSQINNRAVDSWLEFVQKTADATQVRVGQA